MVASPRNQINSCSIKQFETIAQAQRRPRRLLLAPISGNRSFVGNSFEENSYHQTIRRTFVLRDGLCVDVHRALDSRVPQQFLLDLNVGACASQHRRVRMTKRVPTDFPNTSPLRCGPQMALQNVLLCPRSSNSIGKNPVVRIRVQTTLPQFLQWLGKLGIDRKRLAGGFGFGLASSAVYDSPSYQNREVGPIEVAPLQAHDFACAKT